MGTPPSDEPGEPAPADHPDRPSAGIDPEATIELLQELVRIPSPYFEEAEIGAFVFDWLAERGLDPEYHHVSEPAVTGFEGDNVVTGLEGTDPAAPCVLLNAHMDTVQIVEGWAEDPFSGRIEDGRLYGQGACDMKGGLAAAMMAFAALAAGTDDSDRRGDVLFTAVVDEEGPFGLGTDALIRDGLVEDCDAAIVPEPGPILAQEPVENPALLLGARGRFLLEIEVTGEAAHGSRPERGRNAVVAASKIAAAIDSMPVGSHPELGRGSVCPLRIEGGSETLSVPESATLLVDRHVVLGETQADVLSEAESLVGSLGLDADVSVRLRDAPEPEMRYGPYVTDPEEPVVGALAAAAREQAGREPDVGYFSSVGDVNYLGDRAGLPTVILGPDGGNIHGAGEYVETDQVVDVARILADGIARLIG